MIYCPCGNIVNFLCTSCFFVNHAVLEDELKSVTFMHGMIPASVGDVVMQVLLFTYDACSLYMFICVMYSHNFYNHRQSLLFITP